MAKRSGKMGGSPLARLAFFKATPVNRDTLRILDLTPGKAKRKAKTANKSRTQALLSPKPTTSGKVRLVTAAEVAERKAKTRRTFGFDKTHVIAPNSSSKRTR